MKIINIKLKNFITCDDIDLNLKNMKIIGVYGPNAAGKTTVFVDAVLFALYGYEWARSRKIKLEDLIMSGKSFCSVSLTFETIDNTGKKKILEICRILRKNGSSSVELYEYLNNSKKLIAHGDRTVTPYIKSLLKLDCKTFLTTVAVRQGEVLQIAKGSPSERRDLLLRLLGLKLEKAREVAKEKYYEAKQKYLELNERIKMLKKEVSMKNDILSKLNEDKSKLEKISLAKKHLLEEKERLLNEIDNYRSKLMELSRIKGKIDSIKRTIYDIEKQINEANYEITKITRILGDKIDLNNINTILLEINNLKTIIENNIDSMKTLKHNYERLKGELFKLKKFYNKYIGTKSYLESRINSILLECSRLLNKPISSPEELFKEHEKLCDKRMKIIEEKSSLVGLLESIESSIKLLRDAESTCPLCGTNLPYEKKIQLLSKYENDLKMYKHKLDILTKKEKEITYLLNKLENTLNQIQQLNTNLVNLNTQIKELCDEISTIEMKVDNLKKELDAVEGHVIAKLKESKISYMFSEKDIDRIYRKITYVLTKVEKIQATLRSVSNLSKQKTSLLSELNNLMPFEQMYFSIEKKLRETEKALKEVEDNLEFLRNDETRILSNIKYYETKLAEIEKCEKELPLLEKKLKEVSRKKKIYEVLVNRVFSNKGLPSALLRAYAEKIENKVNTILSDILSSDYRIRVKVSKDGEVDLECARRDFLGVFKPRPLETFSGGESTALGFALRLAFSEILAEEHGARVNMLIIDEGFSQLDREHREALVELLKKLINTGIYDQIIAISHIDDVMDYFDERIRVYRDEKEYTRVSVETGFLSY